MGAVYTYSALWDHCCKWKAALSAQGLNTAIEWAPRSAAVQILIRTSSQMCLTGRFFSLGA